MNGCGSGVNGLLRAQCSIGNAASAAPKLLRAELYVHSPDDPTRLAGSGLAIANPPWGLEDELREMLPWLAGLLAQGEPGWRLDWLIEE